MPVAIPALLDFAVLIVALALCVLSVILVKALFGTVKAGVGWIPWLGSKVTGKLSDIEQRLVSHLSEAVTGVELAISASWHILAQLTAHMGYEIAHLARAVEATAVYVTTRYPVKVAHSVLKRVERHTVVIQKTIKVVERGAHATAKALAHPGSGQIAAGVKIATRSLRAEVGRLDRWIANQGAALRQAVAVELPHALGGLRARDFDLERVYANLRKLVHRHERLLGISAFTAATAFALSKLGAGWLRCDNVRNVGRRLCGMDANNLESLLAATLVVVGSISIVDFAKELQDVVVVEADAMRRLIREA